MKKLVLGFLVLAAGLGSVSVVQAAISCESNFQALEEGVILEGTGKLGESECLGLMLQGASKLYLDRNPGTSFEQLTITTAESRIGPSNGFSMSVHINSMRFEASATPVRDRVSRKLLGCSGGAAFIP